MSGISPAIAGRSDVEDFGVVAFVTLGLFALCPGFTLLLEEFAAPTPVAEREESNQSGYPSRKEEWEDEEQREEEEPRMTESTCEQHHDEDEEQQCWHPAESAMTIAIHTRNPFLRNPFAACDLLRSLIHTCIMIQSCEEIMSMVRRG